MHHLALWYLLVRVRAYTRLEPHFMSRNTADILDSLLDLHFPTYLMTSIWDDKSVHTQNMQKYFPRGNAIFSTCTQVQIDLWTARIHFHCLDKRMKAQKKKILPGIAVHNLQFAICSLHFTFVGLDLCRSAMLRALWPWLLLLPICTTLRLKNQLLVFLVMNNVNQGLDWWSWLKSNSKFNYG